MRRRNMVPTIDGMPSRMAPSDLTGVIAPADTESDAGTDGGWGSYGMNTVGPANLWASIGSDDGDDGDEDDGGGAFQFPERTPDPLALPVAPVTFIASFRL